MTDRRRRRGPYPEPIVPERRRDPETWAHSHKQPRWPIVSLAGAVLVLTVTVVILAFTVVELQMYVDGRGKYRDRQATEIRAVICDVLNEFPPDRDLDRVRTNLGCGPRPPFTEESP